MDLARAINFKVGPASIALYESGETQPTFNALIVIAQALDVKLKDVLQDARSTSKR